MWTSAELLVTDVEPPARWRVYNREAQTRLRNDGFWPCHTQKFEYTDHLRGIPACVLDVDDGRQAQCAPLHRAGCSEWRY
jgi:hypothetical protein